MPSPGLLNNAGSSIIPQKRPRPVKSCLSCRNKKLKCDREQPCAQCIRKNQADQCDYDESAGSLRGVDHDRQSSRIIPGTTDNNEGANRELTTDVGLERYQERRIDNNQASNKDDKIKRLEDRLMRLENIVLSRNTAHASSIVERPELIIRENGNDNCQHNQSDTNKKYFGLNSTRSLMSLFPEVGASINNSFSDPDIKSQLENLNRMFPKEKRFNKPRTAYLDTSSIQSIIPSIEASQRLVLVYTSYFPKVYQVLHMPTFRQQLNRFYDSNRTENNAFREEFAPLLVLVLAFGAQFDDQSNFDVRAEYQDASRVCGLVENWLSALEYKRRLQPTTLQTSCLLVLSKKLLNAPPIQLWHQTGDTVRSALAIGLHKDSTEINPDIPPTQAELRRRLWHVISHLDAEVSISCSMPSLVQTLPYKCPSQEQEIAQNSQGLENYDHDDDELLYQRSLSNLLFLNLRALQVLTMMPMNVNISEVRELLADFENERKSVPADIRLSDSALVTGAPAHISNIIMLDMCFRGTMVKLYTLGLQVAGFIRGTEDLTRCISFCMAVMSHTEILLTNLESFEDRTAQEEGNVWKLFHAFNYDDFIRAGYNACYCLKIVDDLHGRSPTVVRPSCHIELEIPATTVRRTVCDFVELYIREKPDLRVVLKQLVALGLAVESTKPTRSEDSKQELFLICLRKLFRLCSDRHSKHITENEHQTRGSVSSETSSSAPTLDFESFTWQDFDIDASSFIDWNLGLSPFTNI